MVFTHSNSCRDGCVWFKVRSVDVRVVGMLLTSGESQHWLAVAAQHIAISPEKFNILTLRWWGDGHLTAWSTSCVQQGSRRVFTLTWLLSSSRSSLLVWTSLSIHTIHVHTHMFSLCSQVMVVVCSTTVMQSQLWAFKVNGKSYLIHLRLQWWL